MAKKKAAKKRLVKSPESRKGNTSPEEKRKLVRRIRARNNK